MTATSCLPKSDCENGLIVLHVNEERLPKISAIPLTILGGTLFYPLTFAIAAIAEVYLSIHAVYCHYKRQSFDKKIQRLKDSSDSQIRKIVDQRLEKLEERLKEQKFYAEKVLEKWKTEFKFDTIGDGKSMLVNLYREKTHEVEAKKKEQIAITLAETFQLGTLEKTIRKISEYDRTCQEIAAFNKATTRQSKYLLTERYKFAKIRCELAKKVDIHYIKTMVKCQLPVIGVYAVLEDQATTKDVLERSLLVDKYNNFIYRLTWLKPY
jgi:hypothetical protein